MLYSEVKNSNDFQDGALLLIDKPLKWSSFDVVKKVKSILRYKIGLKKIKVGHGGTLDPLATGLMIIGIGKATKQLNTLQNEDKEYIADIFLGATTPSYDLETEINNNFETNHITKELIKEKLNEFIGEYDQVPPLFSAKRINGKRAYELARSGSEIELKSVKITFHEIEILDFNMPNVIIRVKCSKGTYIRSLANDIGKEINSGAYLAGLKRISSGNFNIKDALEIESFEESLDNLINEK